MKTKVQTNSDDADKVITVWLRDLEKTHSCQQELLSPNMDSNKANRHRFSSD